MASLRFGVEFVAAIRSAPPQIRADARRVVDEMAAASFEQLCAAAEATEPFVILPGIRCWTRDLPGSAWFIVYKLENDGVTFLKLNEKIYPGEPIGGKARRAS